MYKINFISKLLILSFGASVTAQSTGFTHHLKNLFSKFDENIIFERICAGSCHFDDAGFALLTEVFAKKPDLIIFDWNTTSLKKFDQVLWSSFLSEIIDRKIYTIILLLPRKECIEEKKFFPNFYQVKESSCEMIDVIDGYKFPSFSPSLHLRDTVHTSDEGSYLYAKEIFAKIKSIFKKINSIKRTSSNEKPSFYLQKNQRPVIDKYEISKDKHMVLESIELKYLSDQSEAKPFLLFDMKIGPDSGFLEIASDVYQNFLAQIWDPWCHYSRQSYKKIKLRDSSSQSEKILIKVASIKPDYSTCRNKEFDFTPYANNSRLMRVKSIYSVGCEILECKNQKFNT